MVELLTLGALELRLAGDERQLDALVSRPKRVALLVYLAVARPRGFHRRDSLLGIFWPELSDSRARAALNQALYVLRQELGADVVVTRGNEDVGLRLSAFSCDALAFDAALAEGRLEDALHLYRGDLLRGFHVSDALEFERWLDTERARYQSGARDASKRCAARERAASNDVRALNWLQRAAALAPYDEEVLREHLRTLAALGDLTGVVREYDEFRTRLGRDLELAPSDESATLVRELCGAVNPVQSAAEQPPLLARLDATAIAADDRAPPAALPAPDDKTSSWSDVALPVGGRYRLPHVLVALALVMAVLAFALKPVFEHGNALRSKRVLVLPLDPPHANATLRTVGRMAADWVTQGLQRTGLVEVIDPNTAFRLYTDLQTGEDSTLRAPQIRQLAEGSHARYVVSGTIFRQGSQLRIQVHVTDARDGIVLRTLDPIVADAADLGAAFQRLRDRVSGALATVIDERLASMVAMSSAPPTFEAYQEFERGLDAFEPPWAKAAAHFERAAQLDTSFTLASFWAITALFNGAQFAKQDSLVRALAPRRDHLPPADQAGLDMYMAQQGGDWEVALIAARRAARLAPQSHWAYMAGFNAWRLGRPREALRELDALDTSRGWARTMPLVRSLRMNVLHQLGRYDEQLEAAHQARAFTPTQYPQRFGNDRHEVSALAARGKLSQLDQRMAEFVAAALLPPDKTWAVELLYFTGIELRAHGAPEQAQKYFEWCLSLKPKDPRCLYNAGRYEELLTRLASDTSRFRDLAAAATRLGRYEDAARLRALAHVRDSLALVHGAVRVAQYDYGQTFSDARDALLAGDTARALTILRSEPQRGRLWEMVHWSADFGSLRDHPDVRRLLSR